MKQRRNMIMMWVVLLPLLLIGCSSNGAISGPDSAASPPAVKPSADAGSPASVSETAEEETMLDETFTMFLQTNTSWPYSPDWPIWKAIKDSIGVTLDISLATSEDYNEQVNLLVASGNMPDILPVTSKTIANKFGDDGALLNILDYVDIMPNFKAWMDKYPYQTQAVKSLDGNMYVFPNEGFGELNRVGYIYRKDIFDKHSIPFPANWDELHTVLAQLKELYPDSYPLLFRGGLAALRYMAPGFSSYNDFYRNETTGNWGYGPAEDSYRELIQYLKTFYNEGLFTPDFLNLDTAKWQNMVSADQGFIIPDYLARIDIFNTQVREINPEFTLAFLPPPAGGAKGVQKNLNWMFLDGGITIPSTTKKAEALMKYVDWMYSEQGQEVTTWGIEGVTYEVRDGKKRYLEGYSTNSELQGNAGIFSTGTYTWLDSNFIESVSTDEFWQANVAARNYDTAYQHLPPLTADEGNQFALKRADIHKSMEENISKFILGTRSLDEWDQYVAELQRLGVTEVVEMLSTAYDRIAN